VTALAGAKQLLAGISILLRFDRRGCQGRQHANWQEQMSFHRFLLSKRRYPRASLSCHVFTAA
jgi:hypothetical protein